MPSTADAHRFWFLLPDRLRHQHVRHFRRANAEGIGAKGAMRGGVAIAADDQQAGKRETLLGPDDVYDALARISASRTA